MSENDTSGPTASVTTDQLLIGIGQLVRQLADQTKKMSERLEALDGRFSGSMIEKLDRIAGLLSAPLRIEAPSGGPAEGEETSAGGKAAERLASIDEKLTAMLGVLSIPPAPVTGFEAGIERLEAIEKRLESIQGSLSVLPSQIPPSAPALDISALKAGFESAAGTIDASFTRVGDSINVSLAKAAGEMADMLKAQQERLDALEKALSALSAGDSSAHVVEAFGRLGSEIAASASASGKSVEESVRAAGEAVSKAGEAGLAAVSARISEMAGRLDSIHAALTAAFEKDSAALIAETVAAIRTDIGISSKEMAGRIDAALKSAAGDIGGGMASGRQELAAALKALDEKLTALSGAVSGLERIVVASSEPSTKALSALAELRSQISTASEALVAAVTAAGRDGAASIVGRLDSVASTVSGFPQSVERMREALEGRMEKLEDRSAGVMDAVSGSLDAHGRTLESMKEMLGASAGDQKQALERMTDLLQVHRDELLREQVEDLNNEAIHYFNEGRFTDAASALEKAVALEPNRPELWTNLGHVRASLEDIEGSEICFRKALSLEPDLKPALSGLGILLVKAGRPQETLDFLRRFLDEAPPSARVTIAYARALTAQGRHAEAAALLQKVSTAVPGNPDLEAELARYTEKS
ncbi:tetratricopeptide repeat protein [Candidatus Fermentibacteria bacterium]|nr:tetratricopeptide repeat protein [Candidatus Fermentibacteria bacterium]